MSLTESVSTLVGAAVMSAGLTGCVLWLARRFRLLDVPNPRSAHRVPVPTGGGAAIVVIVCASILLAPMGEDGRLTHGLVVALAGATVAVIGFIDDSRHVSKWWRLLVHSAAIAVVLQATRDPGSLGGTDLSALSWLRGLVVLVALMWLLNLYNFMDGLDGLAAVEAVTVSLGLAAALHFAPHPAPGLLPVCVATAGASLGFLAWNWPPARIFMGDVGSGFLGFLFGALTVIAQRDAGLSPWVPAVLLAVFVTDASVTLTRRMLRGERWYESHRLHAYQWLGRRFGSHRPVTLVVLAVNVLWLMPMAILAARMPDVAWLIAGVAYAPVLAGAVLAGAGRPEAAR